MRYTISYFIRRSERSKGYATEAAHAMALLGFQILKARKLEIHCDTENTGSKQIPLKLGFKLEYSRKGGWSRPDKEELATIETYSAFSEKDLK